MEECTMTGLKKLVLGVAVAAGMWTASSPGQEGVSTGVMEEARAGKPVRDGEMLVVSSMGLANGKLTLEFTAAEGVEYHVQGASSLAKEWMTLDSANNGLFTTDLDGVARFFRLFAPAQGGTGVLSANAVGYTKFFVPGGGWQLVSVPYDNLASGDGSFTFGDTQIANDLPQGSAVMFWNADSQEWSGGYKTARGWSANMAYRLLQPGEGVCVKNATGNAIEVTAAGEVPSVPVTVRSYVGGDAWSVFSHPYPADMTFGETELAVGLPEGSVVYFWDAGKQKWRGGMKSAFGWDPAEANHVLGAGEAFCIRSPAEGTWAAAKPYAWP